MEHNYTMLFVEHSHHNLPGPSVEFSTHFLTGSPTGFYLTLLCLAWPYLALLTPYITTNWDDFAAKKY